MQVYADTIFYNGTFYTMDESLPEVSAIAVKDGKIIAFDEEAKRYQYDATRMKDMKNKVVLPGMIESHGHPLHYAANLYKLDLRAEVTPDIPSILEAVKEKAATLPKGEWIIGMGWDDSKLKEKRFPTMDELSEAAPHHPVFLKRTCVHNAVVNRQAFTASNLPEHPNDPEGGHFHVDASTGRLSGLIQENAMMEFAVPSLTTNQLADAMLEAQKQFYRWGITTVHDMAVTKEELKVFQQLQKETDFSMKVRLWLWAVDQMGWTGVQEEVQALGLESFFGNDRLNIQGLKYMLDGSVGGRTAAVAEAYEGEETNHGILYMDQERIDAYVRQAIENNMRVSIHGIGERAIEMAVQAITTANSAEYNQKMRHRIEHCALPTANHLEKLAAHGIVAGSSVGFIYSIGDSYMTNLGKERTARVFPHRSFQAYGIVAPGNSDLPVCNGNPFLGIYAEVTRKTMTGQQFGTREAISVEEALKSYTTAAAYAGFDEDKIGALRIGNYADMIVLNENPYQIEKEALKDIKVEETIVEGQTVFAEA